MADKGIRLTADHAHVLWCMLHELAPSPKARSILNVLEWHARETRMDTGQLALDLLHRGMKEGIWPWEKKR